MAIHASLNQPFVPGRPPPFDGRLNKAVLNAVVRKNWEELNIVLQEVWNGGKAASEQSKANVVLFVCGSPAACSHAAQQLSAAGPPQATLTLSPAELSSLVTNDSQAKGSLQSMLAAFLKRQPHGVVLIPGVDKIPISVLPVLNNVMGEYGSLIVDGESVSSTDATFLMTWLGPGAVVAEDSEPAFSLAAKKDLTLLLRGEGEGGDDEVVMAVTDAFRRRIDVVAPVVEP